ncbi:DUF551 domain-containing protein [Xanthomonas arboricola]|uniref:DUF551 domain-containing protein n=1 Tax=Xanthomonas arboricola TaxID=56448 RepID=UPI00143225E3|nr:DUF551 domain-containing protein [Xanthomonas arboricola]NJB80339.1 hypothetical protein [Xanthomonas arboricola]
MSEWQPIETAPKDGTRILVWCEHEDYPFPAYWFEHPRFSAWLAFKSHLTTDGDANVVDYFSQQSISHWMPLPEPPK